MGIIIKSVYIDTFRGFSNCRIDFTGDLVAIAGQNGTLKTTLLGMLAQPFSLNSEDSPMCRAKTIDGTPFGSRLEDKFKFSEKFDPVGTHKWTLKVDKSIYANEDFTAISIAREKSKYSIRFWSDDKSKKKGTGYIQAPVIFLSLKRLLPIGEVGDISETSSELTDDEVVLYKKWHDEVLCSTTSFSDVHSVRGSEKSSLGPCTEFSDAKTISAGQDNLGKIILSLLSFKRLQKDFPEAYKGGLLFIDEIETAFYPAAQIQLLKLLFKAAAEFQLQVFFTTHSETILHFLKMSKYSQRATVAFLEKRDGKVRASTSLSLCDIENNLLLQLDDSRPAKEAKIRMYAEDDVTFLFVKEMFKAKELQHFNLVKKVSLGSNQYMTLIEKNVEGFNNAVIVMDGDMNGTKQGIRNSRRRYYKQVGFLPGSQAPEKLLFSFFMNLEESDSFWDDNPGGYTHQLCFRNYTREDCDNLSAVKNWFSSQEQLRKGTRRKLVKYWVQQNPDLVAISRKTILQAYIYVARLLGMQSSMTLDQQPHEVPIS